MVLVARALARLVTFLLLAALAVSGLAVALFSLGSGAGDFSLPGLARLAGLPALSGDVARLLNAVEADGSLAKLSALAALGAILLGGVLLIGALSPRRERLVVLSEDEEGQLAARKRPLGQVAAALAEQARGVTATKVRLRPARSGSGGRLGVLASHPRTADPAEVKRQAQTSLAPLADAFSLKTRVRARLGGAGERVQ